MKASVSASYAAAGLIALAIVAWLASGLVVSNGATTDETPIADRERAAPSTPVVRVRTMVAEPRNAEVVLRGRTQAEKAVALKAETQGRVAGTPVEPGAFVTKGTVICELAVEARDAQLRKAQASMRQRELELQAARTLANKGHRSETQVLAAQAAHDASRAEVRAFEVELEQTRVKAPFDGVVDSRPVDLGDYMRTGDTCATLVALQPFLIVGFAAERDVDKIKAGAPASARLLSGETVAGKVRFVATAADPQTRTFRVEIETPNEGRTLRDGLTAEMRIPVGETKAHKITPALLSLDEKGTVGVKIVEGETVRFMPITLVGEDQGAVWITGLPETATIIVVGQDFVRDGQTVKAVTEDAAS